MKKTLAVITCVLVLAACGKLSNTVTVTNGTESAVEQITVSVCDSTWIIAELAPGESREFTAVYTLDDSFLVETPDFSGSFGYVTHGMTRDRAVITLREDSIQFEQYIEDY